MDDSLQPTVDMLLNVSIFMWFGAVCPWSSFLDNSVIPIYRLIPLGICILLLRRLPFVWSIHKFIPQIEHHRQAIFVGFFGPIGVSAIFYLYVTLEFLKTLEVEHNKPRDDLTNLNEIANVVVWFMAICSIVSVADFLLHTLGLTKSRLCMVSVYLWEKLAIWFRELFRGDFRCGPVIQRTNHLSPSKEKERLICPQLYRYQ
jgi:NhaP-type Na+/H+ or K+/H+ antiporter